MIEPEYLRELAAERRAKFGNKDTRLSKALDDAAKEIERLREFEPAPHPSDV